VNVKNLPEPITIQCVQTDGRLFHFAVLQLNTLDLDSTEGKKNVFWMLPRIPLFTSCTYVRGRPLLEGYNSEVFSRLLAFYSNGLPS
jgi:large subunit ribosomal protein L37